MDKWTWAGLSLLLLCPLLLLGSPGGWGRELADKLKEKGRMLYLTGHRQDPLRRPRGPPPTPCLQQCLTWAVRLPSFPLSLQLPSRQPSDGTTSEELPTSLTAPWETVRYPLTQLSPCLSVLHRGRGFEPVS